MRLLLSFLLILFSSSVFSQKQKVVTLDFTDPASLGLPTGNDNDFYDNSYTLGKAKISFSRGTLDLGVRYIFQNDSYYLEMNKGMIKV